MENMQQQLKNLNAAQKQAVYTPDENILLLAAAGTGKTNVLALRIGLILERKLARPEQILCLTFTNRACKEMKERIVQYHAEAEQVTVKTIHSYCYSLIKQYAKETDIASDVVVYDESDCKELLHEIEFIHLPGGLISVYRFIQHVKEQRLLFDNASYAQIIKLCLQQDPQKLSATCREGGSVNRSLFRFLLEYGAALIVRYNTLLKERHAMDFNDILLLAKQLLENDETASAVRDSFRFIHIDEVQDTTLIEYQIIEKIFGKSKLLLCGDYFQTIYQWRGSKPRDIFSEYTLRYHPIQIVFDCNYRSTKTLLEASTAFLSHSFPEEVQELYGQTIQAQAEQTGQPIVQFEASSIAQEASFIYHTLLSLDLKDLSKAAILCRNNMQNERISEALTKLLKEEPSSLSFLLVEQNKFFESPQVKDILAFLRLSMNPFDDSALTRILLNYANGIGSKTIQKLESRSCRKIGIRLHDFIHPDTITHHEPFSALIEGMKDEKVVVFDVESTGIDTARDEIIQIAAVRLDKNGNVQEKFEKFLTPSIAVGSSEAVHHFSDAFLKKNGESPKKVLEEFCSFIKGTIVVGHNVSFDLHILQSQLMRQNLPTANYETYFDTLDLARRFYPNLPNHRLETLSSLLQTEVSSSHNAMDDILATKDVLCHLLWEKVIPSSQERQKMYAKYTARFEKLSSAIKRLRQQFNTLSLHAMIREIAEISHLEKVRKDESTALRMSELILLAKETEQACADRYGAAVEFLKTAAMTPNSLDRMLKLHPMVPILTVHQSKGCEFDYVFLAGLQDDVFPSWFAAKSGDLSEERRTFYVAMTRAKRQLFLSCSKKVDGKQKKPSRFINEIPQNCRKIVESKNEYSVQF